MTPLLFSSSKGREGRGRGGDIKREEDNVFTITSHKTSPGPVAHMPMQSETLKKKDLIYSSAESSSNIQVTRPLSLNLVNFSSPLMASAELAAV